MQAYQKLLKHMIVDKEEEAEKVGADNFIFFFFLK